MQKWIVNSCKLIHEQSAQQITITDYFSYYLDTALTINSAYETFGNGSNNIIVKKYVESIANGAIGTHYKITNLRHYLFATVDWYC